MDKDLSYLKAMPSPTSPAPSTVPAASWFSNLDFWFIWYTATLHGFGAGVVHSRVSSISQNGP